jgi:peptidoglycan/LPS O-acetylase OafA/YrhL
MSTISNDDKYSREPDFLSYLHGLRGVLSVIVLLFHFNLQFRFLNNDLWSMARAVDGFVVLSGYIICRTVLSKPEGGGKFLLLRLIRLSPVYYFAIFAFLTTDYIINRRSVSFVDVSLHLLYLHNFFNKYTQSIDGAFWSVGLEMSLYFTYAIILAIRRRFNCSLLKVLFVTNLACLLSCVIIRALDPVFTEGRIYGLCLYSRWIQFSVGVYLCLMNGNLFRNPRTVMFWSTLALVSVYMVVTHRTPFLQNYYWAIVVALLMSFILNNKNVQNILANSFLQWIGTISYPMYLIHGTVFLFFASIKSNNEILFTGYFGDATLLCSLPIALLLSHLLSVYERRIIRVLKAMAAVL